MNEVEEKIKKINFFKNKFDIKIRLNIFYYFYIYLET